jgi:hypothetical protein
MQCATHPRTETYLRCGKCETPICPQCTVQTSVGARCKRCASSASSPLFRASPSQYALATVAAIATGLLLGWLPRMLILLGGVIYGYAVGEAALRAGGRRRGVGMQLAAGSAALIGVLFWILGGPIGFGGTLAMLSFSQFLSLGANPFNLIALVTGVVCAVLHVRHI